jgi:hypothetical protein
MRGGQHSRWRRRSRRGRLAVVVIPIVIRVVDIAKVVLVDTSRQGPDRVVVENGGGADIAVTVVAVVAVLTIDGWRRSAKAVDPARKRGRKWTRGTAAAGILGRVGRGAAPGSG